MLKADARAVAQTPLERAIQLNYILLTNKVDTELIAGRVFELKLIDNDQLEDIQLKGGKKRQVRIYQTETIVCRIGFM